MKGANPIKDLELIKQMSATLENVYSKLYADIFNLGIQLGLRGGDLLGIKHSNINLATGMLDIIEIKSGKRRLLRLSGKSLDICCRRMSLYPNDKYLFMGKGNRASKTKPITLQAVNDVLKEVGGRYKLPITTHSLRKTFGWILHTRGVNVSLLSQVFNHSSTKETLLYIGITQEEVLNVYDIMDSIDI